MFMGIAGLILTIYQLSTVAAIFYLASRRTVPIPSFKLIVFSVIATCAVLALLFSVLALWSVHAGNPLPPDLVLASGFVIMLVFIVLTYYLS